MSNLRKIIRDDKHPMWLVDAIVLSAVVYSNNPEDELKIMEREYGLLASRRYEFVPDKELRENGFGNCKQTLLVVRSLSDSHYIVACRGSTDISDAIADLKFMHRSMNLLSPGAAHAGFLDRAKTIPLEYFRRLLVRGEKVVLAGHSLGGAVASLLALRLLEATGRWCHAQVQCYTFGCPFFADCRLARYINKFYQQHFVHVVSKNDIVPKVMPLAHMIYTMWAGLNVGPLSEVLHLSRVGMLVLQLLKLKPIELPLVVTGTQALTWVPNMLRSLLHRALALALSHHSGRRYSFAGHMVLLDDTDSNFLEYADRERWKMGRHLSFHLNCGSLDIVKEHALLSYIDQVFKVEATKQQACGKEMMIQELVTVKAPTMLVTPGISEEALMTTLKVELHSSTLKMNCFNNMNPYAHQQMCVVKVERGGEEEMLAEAKFAKKKLAGKILRIRVACLIFIHRLQEAHPKSFKPRLRKIGMMERVVMKFQKVTKFVHRFDIFFLASSALCVGIQAKRFLIR